MSKEYILKDVRNNKTLIWNSNDEFKYSVTSENDVIHFTKNKYLTHSNIITAYKNKFRVYGWHLRSTIG